MWKLVFSRNADSSVTCPTYSNRSLLFPTKRQSFFPSLEPGQDFVTALRNRLWQKWHHMTSDASYKRQNSSLEVSFLEHLPLEPLHHSVRNPKSTHMKKRHMERPMWRETKASANYQTCGRTNLQMIPVPRFWTFHLRPQTSWGRHKPFKIWIPNPQNLWAQ